MDKARRQLIHGLNTDLMGEFRAISDETNHRDELRQMLARSP
ncbi:MAG TPA: hypothetical protein VLD67_18140 [Vicinamibacterales bacterium]|nr:hypothetical protein [Vicinamibacterales bacterium]